MHTEKYQSIAKKRDYSIYFPSLTVTFNKDYFLANNLKYTYYKILEKLIIMYSKQEFFSFEEN